MHISDMGFFIKTVEVKIHKNQIKMIIMIAMLNILR
jgi:hypothetical protein